MCHPPRTVVDWILAKGAEHVAAMPEMRTREVGS